VNLGKASGRKMAQEENELERVNPSHDRRPKSSLHVASLRLVAFFVAIQRSFSGFGVGEGLRLDIFDSAWCGVGVPSLRKLPGQMRCLHRETANGTPDSRSTLGLLAMKALDPRAKKGRCGNRIAP
jgi:hypothetical protein